MDCSAIFVKHREMDPNESKNNYKFECRVEETKRFKEQFGITRVGAKLKTKYPDWAQQLDALGKWMDAQRNAKQKNTLPAEREKILLEIGVDLTPGRGKPVDYRLWNEKVRLTEILTCACF